MQIAFVAYEGLTTLDLIGPYELLGRLPGADVRFVSQRKGELRVDTGHLGLVIDHALGDVPSPDVFVVPGGLEGTRRAAQDPALLAWLREAAEGARIVASVCTGSVVLGAAGLLDGRRATTHWAARPWLEGTGATFVAERVVRDGKFWTAAGVSAGIDLALHVIAELADEEVARAIQLAVEYDPAPPFDAGSPERAGEAVIQRAQSALAGT